MNAFARAQANRDYSEDPLFFVTEPGFWDDEDNVIDFCDHVAEMWVRDGGDLALFNESREEISRRILTGNVKPYSHVAIYNMAIRWMDQDGLASKFDDLAENISEYISDYCD